MHGLRGHIAILVGVAFLALHAAPARAQLAVSAALDSDYRFRGLSLSQGQPDLRLNLSFDDKSGAYGGVTLVTSRAYEGKGGMTGEIAYAGYVSPKKGGLAWEAGAVHSHFDTQDTYDYSEVYGGVLGDHFSARVAWSPRYYGRHMQTLYSEFNTGQRLSEHVRLFEHVGALTPMTSRWRRERYDLSAGVAMTLKHYELRAAWTQTSPSYAYPQHTPNGGDTVVVSVTCYF